MKATSTTAGYRRARSTSDALRRDWRRAPSPTPFTVKQYGEDALRLYAEHLAAHPELVDRAVTELAGRDLACWCRPESPCHADILIRQIELRVQWAALPQSVQGLIEAADELASKLDLPVSNLACERFLRALVEVEVDVLGTERETAERLWLEKLPEREATHGE